MSTYHLQWDAQDQSTDVDGENGIAEQIRNWTRQAEYGSIEVWIQSPTMRGEARIHYDGEQPGSVGVALEVDDDEWTDHGSLEDAVRHATHAETKERHKP